MSGIYSALGGVFEYFNDDCGYDKWSQYLIERINSLGIKPCARGAGTVILPVRSKERATG